jgi:hypothetical protein
MALINDDVPNGGGPLRAAGSFGRRLLRHTRIFYKLSCRRDSTPLESIQSVIGRVSKRYPTSNGM